MAFDCRQCGSCCMYLGDYIVIERQTGPFMFDCESVSTGSPFTAEIDEDKRTIFMDFAFPEQNPTACRFLRPDGDLLRCTIHRDSPVQCKFYRCVVMRVSDASGMLIGTVRGTLDLHSDDPGLRAVWEELVRKRPKDDGEAEPWIAWFLQEKGYQVE
jgi:Fe-S-cluster containining protein